MQPIADNLQKEQLNNNCDHKQKEIDDLREKNHELELKIAEVKLNDDLIAELRTAALSKENHIEDLQTINSELLNANHNFKQLVDSVSKEIVQLKSLIKEEFELSKIDQLNKNSRTNSENTVEMKALNATLKSCQLNLSESQRVVLVYEEQLGITRNTIEEKYAMISQLMKQVQSKDQKLKEFETKLTKNQYELKNQEEIIEEKEHEIIQLKDHIKKGEVKPTSCINYGHSNSVHNVEVPHFKPFRVLCNSEFAGPGWTVIQQRINGGENFYRNWQAYKNGFGDFTGDFFLGLENIYRLTNNQAHELYIHMERFNGRSEYVRYDNFKVAGEKDKYRLLSLGMVSGNVENDNMRANEHMKFSTYDSLNEKIVHPAEFYHGAWWYGNKTSW